MSASGGVYIWRVKLVYVWAILFVTYILAGHPRRIVPRFFKSLINIAIQWLAIGGKRKLMDDLGDPEVRFPENRPLLITSRPESAVLKKLELPFTIFALNVRTKWGIV